MRLHEFPPTEIVSCPVGREGEPKAPGEKAATGRRGETGAGAAKAFGSRATSNWRWATTGPREKGNNRHHISHMQTLSLFKTCFRGDYYYYYSIPCWIQEAEERRLEAVKEAIAGAQQNALAEKLARRRNLQSRTAVVQTVSDNDPAAAAASVSVRSEDRSTPAHQHLPVTQREPTLVELRHAIISTPRPQQLDKGTLTRSSVDAQVQTDQQQLQVACRCETNNPRSRQSRSIFTLF